MSAVERFNKWALYYPHKFEEYFESGLDASETIIGRDVEQTGPKKVSKRYIQKDWTRIEPLTIFLARQEFCFLLG